MLEEHEKDIPGLEQPEDMKLLEPETLELWSFKLGEKLPWREPELQDLIKLERLEFSWEPEPDESLKVGNVRK